MNWFFSDRYRFHKLGAAILLVAGLCIHTHIVGNQYAQQRSIILEAVPNKSRVVREQALGHAGKNRTFARWVFYCLSNNSRWRVFLSLSGDLV